MTLQRTSKPSIVLVEDDAALRDLLTDVLATSGFLVTVIRLAEDAIETLRVTPADLLVLDLVMPTGTMQGAELLALLRETEAWRYVPVVILSGYGEVVNPDIMARLGAGAVLTKPLAHVDILPTTIRALLA